ncbi:MAG TPA: 3-keto-5-aminohexanoate cleavage protein [Devosiaceae bacterium]|nr:3-keto-5-aminohexanoate cleavage protein [Devosiaceae bacterium]
MTKTILTCAVTGASLSPSMSPHLPLTPAEITEQSLAAVEAGAAILHLHARDPADGRPTRDMGVWREILTGIRAGTDAIINMSASMGATAEDRLEATLELRPDIATVIVGSMNYGLFRKAQNQGISEFSLDWEKEAFGPASYEIVTSNTFAKIDRMIEILVAEGIGIEFECYDVGHLYILEHHLRRHQVKRPIVLQFLTGILGGIPSDVEHLVHLKTTALQLFGPDVQLFIHGTGMGNIRAATAGGLLGTHVRIGQEDNLFDRPRVPFASNAAQVERIRQIFGLLNIETATVAEARDLLRLPG